MRFSHEGFPLSFCQGTSLLSRNLWKSERGALNLVAPTATRLNVHEKVILLGDRFGRIRYCLDRYGIS